MLNISKKITIGWSLISSSSKLPAAEVIPIGNTPSEKRKSEKFSTTHSNTRDFDNIPLPGFTVYEVSKKNWSSSDSSWVIIDPRGFLIRITNENIAAILAVSGITEGLIQEKCIWARDNANTTLSLMPVSSSNYEKAVGNTILLEEKVSINDVQIGDTVFLQNNLIGTYLGVLSLYGTLHDNASSNGLYKTQASMRKQVIETSPGKFHYHTDARILKVLNKTTSPKTKEESAEYINNIIATDPNTYFTSTNVMTGKYYSYGLIVKYVSTHSPTKVKIQLEEIDKYEAAHLFNNGLTYRDSGMLVIENATGQYIIDYPYYQSSPSPTVTGFQTNKIIKIDDISISIEQRKFNAARSLVVSLDNFTKFYKIVKCVKDGTYV